MASFYYHPRMLAYDFGPGHPLKPERLRRTVSLLERYGVEARDPGHGEVEDALRRHDSEYIDAVRRLSEDPGSSAGQGPSFGFGRGDNPPFAGMFEASLGYLAGTVQAAHEVAQGAALALSLSGGLHHALRDRASGFCIFNDPAIAADILLDSFERVAYVDIDLHHGDGVQWLWFDEPRVFTYSIHQHPRTLFPGTGLVEETGSSFTSMNVPLEPGTTGEVWLDAFERTALPALERFRPQAIVLQMGTDPHFLDPLGHLQVSAQDWREAVLRVRDLGLPILAVGGGGYNLTTVPRMWTSAVLALMKIPFGPKVDHPQAEEWGVPAFDDVDPPRGSGAMAAEGVIGWHELNFLPKIPA